MAEKSLFRWKAHLKSNYRGLSSDETGIEVRPLTLLLGPNNGGKSQFLRSLVLLDACRRLVENIGEPRASARGVSLVQVLTDIGFKDLAEELPVLMKGGKSTDLSWDAEVSRPLPMTSFVAGELGYPSGEGKKHSRTEPASAAHRRLSYTASLSYDESAQDLLLAELKVENLWEELSVVVRQPTSSVQESAIEGRAGLRAGRRPAFFGFSISLKFHGRALTIDEFVKLLINRTAKSRAAYVRSGYFREMAGQELLSTVFSFLPRVTYVGPIRIRDDRDYAVASGRLPNSVGREGEFTWVLLRELGSPKSEAREWFERQVRNILSLSDFRGQREKPTVPRVLAREGAVDYALHNFGLGTSQVLPILVQLAATYPDRERRSRINRGVQPPIIVVEEPETHLHPAAQRALSLALADYVAVGGRTVVETHSEVILRTIETCVGKKRIPPSSYGVNWVQLSGDPTSEGHGVFFLPFDPNGELKGKIPSTFDEVVPALIEERLIGKVRTRDESGP